MFSTGTIRVDGIYDFLNIPAPDGPVTLRAESVGAADRVYIAERNIHVLGPPENILPYEENISIPAGSRSEKNVRFDIRDEWNYKLDHLKIATVDITHGNITSPDLDSISSGIQIPVHDGVLEISIKAPKETARAILEISVMGEPFQFPVKFSTPQGSFIMVGSLSGGASNYQPFPDDSNEPDTEDWRQHTGEISDIPFMYGGRAAFYAKGNVFGKYLLTASYDSRRNYKDQFYEDIDPSEQYPVYGDASSLEYDAQSQSPLFVKLERDGSSIMFGDFSTSGMNKTEFTAYNRTFNGLRGTVKRGSHSLSGFASLTDREMQLDEIRGEGISGYYYLSKSNVTEYSDKILIQTRDKYHPETVIRSVEQIRFQDYSINYNDGSIMFKQPVPSVDGNGNPVTIVIAYEHKTGKRESGIAGLRYEGTVLNRMKFGATAVMEERSSSRYILYGADAVLPIFKWLSMKGEYAGSIDPQPVGDDISGNAYKAEVSFAPSKFLNIRGYYRNVDSSFVNPSQSGRANEIGSQKFGFKGVMGNELTGQLTSELYRQQNKRGTVNENSAEIFNLAYQRKFGKRAELKIGYEDALRIRRSAADTTSERHSQLIRGNLTYKITKKISALIERDQNLESNDQSKPTHTAIGLNYAISEKLGIFAKYRRLEGENAGNQIVFGLDSKVAENTQLTGKYEIGGAVGESRNRASIGLKNKWNVTKDLTFNFAYENVSTSDHFEIPTPENQALSVAFEYLPEIPWKSSGKWEVRNNNSSRRFNYIFATDFRIAHGLSVIAKSVYSKTAYHDGQDDHVIKSDNQFGLAYRPERSDHYNSLVKIACLVDENTHVRRRYTPNASFSHPIITGSRRKGSRSVCAWPNVLFRMKRSDSSRTGPRPIFSPYAWNMT
ncbi:MAG: hypothetical protein U5N26_11390 [Candidatus Marinimicrobia bacterium]|nr:hypothetical protein [Candidatus Neomarinimicrobiota bacterium]